MECEEADDEESGDGSLVNVSGRIVRWRKRCAIKVQAIAESLEGRFKNGL